MDLQSLSTILSVAVLIVTILVLQPLKTQLENLSDTLKELKVVIEVLRKDAASTNSEIAVHDRDIKALWKRIDKIEARLNDMNERGCCHVEQD